MANRPSPRTYTYLLDFALEQEIGMAFVVTGIPRKAFRNQLYEAREMSGDPRYAELVMFMPAAPHDNEIFICKRAVEIDP
jgi:hypothetical protein